jgi:hypothetical protein
MVTLDAAGMPGAGEAKLTPQLLGLRGPRATSNTHLRKSFASASPARHYRCPLSLQANFVAAIDVYEDGEAGLLLCYNCKSLRPKVATGQDLAFVS